MGENQSAEKNETDMPNVSINSDSTKKVQIFSIEDKNPARTICSSERYARSHEEFKKYPYAQKDRRQALAFELGLSEDVINGWFIDERKRIKVEMLYDSMRENKLTEVQNSAVKQLLKNSPMQEINANTD